MSRQRTEIEMLNRDEACAFLRCSIAHLERLYQRERVLPYYKMGKTVLFNKQDLVKYIESLRVEVA